MPTVTSPGYGTVTVPTSQERNVLIDLIAALESDTDIKGCFAIDPIQDGIDPDTRYRRILRFDPGNATGDTLPRLCMTVFRDYDDVDSMGQDSGTYLLDIKVGATIYVPHNPSLDGEYEKDLCTDLTGLLRSKLRRLAYQGEDLGYPWYDIQFGSPATQFDTSENFHRGITIFDVMTRWRNYGS